MSSPAQRPIQRVVAGSDPGVRIALLQWGDEGPVVLAHHANGFCAGQWSEVAEALAPRFRVVAMDARGHGDSSKPEDLAAYDWHHFVADWVAVAEQVAADAPGGRIALGVGHSFGGAALCMAAAERPALFDALLMLDPVILPADYFARTGNVPGEHPAEKSERRRSVWPSREEAVALWAERAFFASWTPRARELYAQWGLADRPDGQVGLKCPPEVEAAVFRSGGTLDPLPVADRVAAESLFVHATRGNFDAETYRRVAARMPRARVESADVGHLMVMEDPEFVVEAALRLLDQDSTG